MKNNRKFQLILLHLKMLCDVETPKMKKTSQDRVRGMLFLGLLFISANICAADIYFGTKEK